MGIERVIGAGIPGRRYLIASLLAGLLTSSLVPVVAAPSSAAAPSLPTLVPSGPCVGIVGSEENHASIRLSVDNPAAAQQLSVDAKGQITVGGVLHKQATMVDVTDGAVSAAAFTIGPPPPNVAAWASSWSTAFRPPHLGANQLCARAKRDPKRTARILRSFTIVDLIPPGVVPGLAVGGITPNSATVTWSAATDNYGLAGYQVRIDGGPPHRTSVGTRTFVVTGLLPQTSHTVSVIALDLGGNTSTPATTSFTTAAAPPPPPPPPPPGSDLTVTPDVGSALATWHPSAADAAYRLVLNGVATDQFARTDFCFSTQGAPANPCTAQDVISVPVSYLESGTAYTLQVDALAANGSTDRTLSASFTTAAVPPLVRAETVQQDASETRRCAALGGSVYLTSGLQARGTPVPSGATQLFAGCWKAIDSSCVDAVLPPSRDGTLGCSDDVTRYLQAIAPSGHGPLLDFVGPALLPPPQPITTCFVGGACTVALEEGAEAIELAVLAAAEGTAIAAVAVVAAEIVIAVALAAVLTVIFAEELGIAGLFEYPIHFDTNFQTFTNWGANKGVYYNSLQIYTEIITTTNEFAGRQGLPFAWSVALDQALKETIDRACTAQEGRPSVSTPGACGTDFVVYVPGGTTAAGGPLQQTGQHIVDATSTSSVTTNPARVQWFYPGRSVNGAAARSRGFRERWYDTAAFRPNSCVGRIAAVCDEFPFWSTDQAVNLSGTVADLQPVPILEGRAQGNDLATFYSRCRVSDNTRFLVVPIAPWVAALGPSFGFRIGQGRVSRCHGPGVGQ